MKKYMPRLLVLICTAALVFTLSVPVFAAEETTMRIGGTWRFNDVLIAPSTDLEQAVDFSVSCFFNGVDVVSEYSGIRCFLYSNVPLLQYYLVTLSIDPDFAEPSWLDVYDNDIWADTEAQTITFTEEQEVSYEFYQWFTANASRYSGEEQTPDLDTNPDNVPDTVKYNNTTLPNIEKVWDKTKYNAAAIVYDAVYDRYVLHIGTTFKNDHIYNEETFTVEPECFYKIGDEYQRYYCEVGDTEWSYIDTNTNSVAARTSNTELVWASATIYTDSTRSVVYADFFRPSPLTLMLTGVDLTAVTGQLMSLIPITLAFLVGYKGFLKAFQILRETLLQA